MTRFNAFLILLVLLILASCARIAMGAENCPPDPKLARSSLADMQKLSKFLQMNEKHPEFMYHYNGVSVTKERFEQLMKETHDKTQDPNLRMP